MSGGYVEGLFALVGLFSIILLVAALINMGS